MDSYKGLLLGSKKELTIETGNDVNESQTHSGKWWKLVEGYKFYCSSYVTF